MKYANDTAAKNFRERYSFFKLNDPRQVSFMFIKTRTFRLSVSMNRRIPRPAVRHLWSVSIICLPASNLMNYFTPLQNRKTHPCTSSLQPPQVSPLATVASRILSITFSVEWYSHHACRSSDAPFYAIDHSAFMHDKSAC